MGSKKEQRESTYSHRCLQEMLFNMSISPAFSFRNGFIYSFLEYNRTSLQTNNLCFQSIGVNVVHRVVVEADVGTHSHDLVAHHSERNQGNPDFHLSIWVSVFVC